MTKEDLLNKTNLSLTMKQLREFINKNTDIKDDAPVLIERVSDFHFNPIGGNWDVLKVEGEYYNNQKNFTKEMQDEIDRRDRGEEPEYGMEDPSKYMWGEDQLEITKEEFYIPSCITTDKEIVYIYSHYYLVSMNQKS